MAEEEEEVYNQRPSQEKDCRVSQQAKDEHVFKVPEIPKKTKGKPPLGVSNKQVPSESNGEKKSKSSIFNVFKLKKSRKLKLNAGDKENIDVQEPSCPFQRNSVRSYSFGAGQAKAEASEVPGAMGQRFGSLRMNRKPDLELKQILPYCGEASTVEPPETMQRIKEQSEQDRIREQNVSNQCRSR